MFDFFKECLIGKRINNGSKRFKEIKKRFLNNFIYIKLLNYRFDINVWDIYFFLLWDYELW